MDIKYLYNGAIVFLVAKIEQGYLVKNCHNEHGEYYEGELTYLVDKIFDSPPTQQYADEVVKLQDTINQLGKEIRLLRKERDTLQNYNAKVKQTKLYVGFN